MTDNENKVCEALNGAGRTSNIVLGVHTLCVIMAEAGRDGKINEQVKKLEGIKEAVRKALLNSMLDGRYASYPASTHVLVPDTDVFSVVFAFDSNTINSLI